MFAAGQEGYEAVVDEETGILLRTGEDLHVDPAALAHATGLLLDDTTRRTAMGAAARKKSRKTYSIMRCLRLGLLKFTRNNSASTVLDLALPKRGMSQINLQRVEHLALSSCKIVTTA